MWVLIRMIIAVAKIQDSLYENPVLFVYFVTIIRLVLVVTYDYEIPCEPGTLPAYKLSLVTKPQKNRPRVTKSESKNRSRSLHGCSQEGI